MNRVGNGRLSQRIAEETQLLAEEKWIIKMLAELNRQKNSLQIERLHLEHLKAQILKGKPDGGELKLQQDKTTDPSASKPDSNVVENGVSDKSILEYNVPAPELDEEACNNEELNLSITNSVFANADHGFDIEEEEEDLENCVIDMNMFMYGG